jgi:uncharacterized protein
LEQPEVLSLGPVRWRGQVVFADPGYYLKARLSYEQTLSCNRCLKPIVEHAEPEVELMIVVERPRAVAGEHELKEDELGVLTIPEEILETDPILLEQLQLNVPMKPLCRPDCRGLCPECGADLNAGECSCETHAGDARFAALAVLKSRLDSENG